MATFDFQCQNIKCYLSLPRVFALAGHASTGHSTNFRIRGNNTLDTSSPPPPTSTPFTCGNNLPCVLSICCCREEAAIFPLRTSQHSLVLFLNRKFGPSPVDLRLYALDPCCPHMSPGVHIISLVLSRFVCNLILSKFLPLLSAMPAPRLYLTLLSVRYLRRSRCCVTPLTTQNHVEPPEVHRYPEGLP